MRDVLRLVDRVTDLSLPVLVVGESGTGKELVARAIHFNGPRRRARIVGENCGAVPETLMESEFFGYVRGAFTGAVRDHAGLFEQADKGTLFLDEVGETSPEMQKKLLRVLEEGEVRRVGGKAALPVDVRIVSATNRPSEMSGRPVPRESTPARGVVITLPRDRKGRHRLVAHFVEAGRRAAGARTPATTGGNAGLRTTAGGAPRRQIRPAALTRDPAPAANPGTRRPLRTVETRAASWSSLQRHATPGRWPVAAGLQGLSGTGSTRSSRAGAGRPREPRTATRPPRGPTGPISPRWPRTTTRSPSDQRRRVALQREARRTDRLGVPWGALPSRSVATRA
jgi:hypothetical protein